MVHRLDIASRPAMSATIAETVPVRTGKALDRGVPAIPPNQGFSVRSAAELASQSYERFFRVADARAFREQLAANETLNTMIALFP